MEDCGGVMNYTLCHKDIPVLRFSTEDEEISEVSEILCREHLPVGISPDKERNLPNAHG